MKLLAALSVFTTAAAAWQVRFVGIECKYIDAPGIQSTNCHMFEGEPQQNMSLISFSPATDWYPDPEYVYVYSEGVYGNNGLTIIPSNTPMDKLIGSYIVE